MVTKCRAPRFQATTQKSRSDQYTACGLVSNGWKHIQHASLPFFSVRRALALRFLNEEGKDLDFRRQLGESKVSAFFQEFIAGEMSACTSYTHTCSTISAEMSGFRGLSVITPDRNESSRHRRT